MKHEIKEEETYQFYRFNAKMAFQIGCHAVKMIEENNLNVCIEIYAFSKTLFHYASDLSTVNNEEWIKKKRNSVLYFAHSTKFLNIKNNNDPTVLQKKYGLQLDQYCITMGGFPIRIKNCGVVGSICVSGMLPEQDHQFIIDLLDWYFHREQEVI